MSTRQPGGGGATGGQRDQIGDGQVGTAAQEGAAGTAEAHRPAERGQALLVGRTVGGALETCQRR